MRKLVHELFKGPINISEKLTYIVVENPNVFYKMVKSLCNQVLNKTNAEEAFVLLDDESKLELSKSAIMFFDLLNFEINSKKIKNELIKKIEKDARNLNENKLTQINDLIQDYFEELFGRYFINVNYLEEVDLCDFLKLYKVEVCNEDDSLLTTLINWLTSFTELTKIYTFLFVNLSTFLSQKELIELEKYAEYNKVSIILFENLCEHLTNIREINVIDNDLCHIIVHKMV